MQGYGKASLADFIAVFFHISHWYLSWITLAKFLFPPIQGYGKASPTALLANFAFQVQEPHILQACSAQSGID